MLQVSFAEPSCLYPQTALHLEWLETNGRGGYASSSLLHCHTRKYHGLLVANLLEPAGRHVLLSKFEDSLSLGEEEHFLSCHQYPGLFFPQAGHCLRTFAQAPAPCFTYRLGNLTVRKTILMLEEEGTVLFRYDLEDGPDELLLRLRPFFAFRGFHGTAKKNPFFAEGTVSIKDGFKIQPYPHMPALFLSAGTLATFSPGPHWYYNFEYPVERERGYDWQEDLFSPGTLEIPIKYGQSTVIAASLHRSAESPGRQWAEEERRRTAWMEEEERLAAPLAEEDRELFRQLLRAGRQFLITTSDGRPAIIAGYHWFDEWGRDALISLPGLTFCSGQADKGFAILETLGKQEKDGIIPNYFSPDGKNNAYNSVDASLWYFWAVQQLLKYTGDLQSIERTLWPVMKKIIKNFMTGTLFDIRMAASGLLQAGHAGTHITWMDAVVGGLPVTPRGGFPVEINALWYNALCFARELAERFGESPPCSEELLQGLPGAFQEMFWIEEGAYLGDVCFQGSLDRSIRPNQLLALSLPFSPLTAAQAAGVVQNVQEHLLTPCGLRTLAPQDRHYRGRYEGNTEKRDSAYHQGTVWPWLLGPFGEAYLQVQEDKQAAKAFLLGHLRTFLGQHLREAGVGCVSEIFDGDPPHTPRGCIAQAWSTGELIRLYRLLQDI